MIDLSAATGRRLRQASTAWLGALFAAFMLNPESVAQCTTGALEAVITPTGTFQTVSVPAGGPSYYEFTAVSGNSYEFSLCSADGATAAGDDSYLTLSDATPVSLQTADDNCDGAASRMTWNAATSGTYRIYVSNFVCDPRPAGYVMAYRVTAAPPPVPGDLCSNAIDLSLLTSPLSSTTAGAANNYTNTCASGNSDPDLVYFIDVPANYTLVIGQTDNSYDSEVTVFYGGSCPGATQIACFDDPDIQNVTWVNNTGLTQRVYWVQDGFFSGNSGAFTLAWTLTAPPICLSPAGSAAVVQDCGNNQFFVNVTVTGTGDEATVDVESDQGGNPGGQTGVGTGTYQLGPFASATNVQVFIRHADESSCDVALGTYTFDCTTLGLNALNFDGTDDRVEIPHSTSLDITGTAVTLEAWIYPTAWRAESWRGSIINKEAPGTAGYMIRCGNNGQLSFNVGTGTSWLEIISATGALSLNTWQHVAGTFDGTTLRIYRDGNLIGSAAATGSIASTTAAQEVAIGNWSQDNTRGFIGSIDEARIWNVVRSQSGIQSRMNLELCGDEPGLVGYYQFDQGVPSGNNAGVTTLNDATANANNGTLLNMALNGTTSNWVPGKTPLGACVAITCFDPTNLNVTGISGNGATLTWTDNGSASYDYEVRTSGAPGSGPAGLVASGNVGGSPATVSGLSATTNYTAYVRSSCTSPTATSDWVERSFTTTQLVATLPWVVDFTDLGGGQLANGTQTNQWFNGAAAGNPAPGLYVTNDAGATNSYNNTATSVAHYYRDVQFPATGSINLQFDWSVLGEACCDYVQVWMVPTSFAPAAGTLPTASGTAPTGNVLLGQFNNNGGWSTATISVPGAYNGTTSRLLFSWRNDFSVGGPPAAIDNINLTVGAPLCATLTAPANGVPVSNTAGTTLTWDASNGADGYLLYLGTDGAGVTYPTTIANAVDLGNVLTYTTGALAINGNYYWTVVPYNTFGPATATCTIRNFNTNPPACIATPTSPAIGGTACSLNPVTLSWPASPGATSYEVFLNGNSVQNSNALTYTTGALGVGPQTWSVVPSNDNGPAAGCATWNFTTNEAACICIPLQSGSSCLTNVTFGATLNNTGAACAAPFYTSYVGNGGSTTGTFARNVPYPFTFTADASSIVSVWIDYDHDLTFEASEWYQPATSGTTATINITIPLTAALGNTYMRVRTRSSGSPNGSGDACTQFFSGETEDYAITIDPAPVCPSASIGIVDDCGTSSYTLAGNITDLGSGASATVSYTVNGGAPVVITGLGIGAFTLPAAGSFAASDVVLVNIATDTGFCTKVLGSFTGSCPVTFPCNSPIIVTNYCYGPNNRTWTYTTSNSGESVVVNFLSGCIAAGDVITVYDGTNNGATIIGTNSGATDLTGLSFVSTGESVFIEVSQSTSGQTCQEGGVGACPWSFTVGCNPACTAPTGNAVANASCPTIDVNLVDQGDGGPAGISYTVNGGAPTVITGIASGTSTNIGPFATGQSVVVTLLHGDQVGCATSNTTLAPITIPAYPNLATLNVTATPATACNGGTSQLLVNATAPTFAAAVVYSTGTGATLDPMTGATQLVATGQDDAQSALTNIGFNFVYNGTTYTNFGANSNGNMRLGAQVGTAFTNNTATYTSAMLSPLFDDHGTSASGIVNTVLVGTAPNRIRVINFNLNISRLGTLGQFQVWLYETTNVIEFRYGATTASTTDATLQITGVNTANFQSVQNFTGHTITTAARVHTLSGWPGAGRYYRWTPYTPNFSNILWTPNGNLNDATIANPIASNLTAPTTYNVTATLDGCVRTGSVSIAIASPVSSANITPASPFFCGTGNVVLTANVVGGTGPYTYAWTGPSGPAGTAATQTANAGGTWSVLITDACGSTGTASTVVDARPTPVASITQTSPVCVGGSVTLTAASTVGGSTFAWTGAAPVGGSTTNAVTINSLTAANTGTYSVIATANGCPSASVNTSLVVNPLPTITSVTATPATICSGTNSQLQAVGTAPGYVAGPGTVSFVDISATGTSVGTPTDDSEHNVTIPSFTFNGVAYTALRIGNNGKIVFGATTGEVGYNNSALPYPNTGIGVTTAGYAALMPYWDDLTPGTGGSIRTQQIGNTFIVQWTNEDSFSATGTGTITFQVQLNLTTGQIHFAYSDVDFTVGDANSRGQSATIGLSYTNTSFLQYSFNQNVLVPGQVITFTQAQPSFTWSPATFLSATNIANPVATAVTANTEYTVTAATPQGCTTTGTVTVSLDLTDTDNDGIIDCVDNCDNLPGQIGDFCDDGNPNTPLTLIDATCTCVGAECTTDLSLAFSKDATSDVNWYIHQQGTNFVVQQGTLIVGASTQTVTTCVPDGCYYLRVTDDLGDGIGGGYVLRVLSSGLRVIDNAGNFNSGSTSQIASNQGFCIPLGTDRLIYTSCDKLDWVPTQYLYANDNPAVTAVWNSFAAGSTQRANSGYEMWWYNPNGGYSFRRFQSHNTANGLTASATRACGFRPNSWTGNQLQNGVLYNVRVRSRLYNVPVSEAQWGPACRFILDPTRAQCPLTKLLDTPGNQYLSCGATRAIGTSQTNLVHALQVTRIINGVSTAANRYQFRFTTDGGGSVITKTSAVGQYWVTTGGTPSLAPCKTYDVEVRASFDGGTTWCNTFAASNPYAPLWGQVCQLNTSGCASGNGGNQNMATESTTGIRMFPNPNRGDQLTLSIDMIEEGVNTVSVDIFDVFGKRVDTRTIATQGSFVNTVLDLNGSLAAGMYTVNITAGSAAYTERLVIQP